MPPLATAYVRVRPDMTGFKAQTEAGMATAVPAAGKTGKASGATFGSAFGKSMGTETDKELKTWQSKVGAAAGQATSKLAKIGAVAFAAAAAYSVKSAADFQAGITTLETGAGELRKNLKADAEGIKQIAVATGSSTKSLIDGMYMINSAGFKGAAGLKVLKAAAEGAKVGVADLGVVGDAVTTLLKDYHLSADDAAASTSALVATVAAGKTKMDLLGPALARVLPTASVLGIRFGEVGGAIATMTAHGVTARLAATRLNSTLTALAAPNAVAAKAMAGLGITSKQVADTLTKHGLVAALDLVHTAALKAGPEGSPAFVQAMKAMLGGASGLGVGLLLTGKNAAEFAADAKKIGDTMASGTAQVKGWSAVQGDLNFKLDKLKATLQVAAIDLGEKLLPVLTKTVGWLVKSHMLIPLITIVMGVLTAAIIAQAIAWQLTPFAWVADAIVAIIAVVVIMYTKFAWFRTVVQAVWGWIKDHWGLLFGILTLGIGPAIVWIVQHFPQIERVVLTVVKAIITYFGFILRAATDAFGWIPGVGDKLRAASAAFARFKGDVNKTLAGINDRTISVGVDFSGGASMNPPAHHAPVQGIGHAARGLFVRHGTSGIDDQLIMAQKGELVVPADLVSAGAADHLRGMIPGFAHGGRVGGVRVAPRLPTNAGLEQATIPAVTDLARMMLKSGMFTTALGIMIARYAQSFVGKVPYVWGGTSPVTGWDCSGMTGFVYRHFGFNTIPRVASAQQAWAQPVGFPMAGALAFFGGADGTAASAGHVGIVVGSNLMANAFGTGFGTIDSSFASGGAFGGFGIPPGRRFGRGGRITEPVVGIDRRGRSYMFGEAGGETVVPDSGLARIEVLLEMLIGAVRQNSGDTAHGVAVALGGAAHTATVRAEWSPR